MKKEHLLLIAYYYPPMPSVGAMRMNNVAESAQNLFDQVHIITTRNAFHFGPIEASNVHGVTTLDYRSISLNQLKRKELHYGGKFTKSTWKQKMGQLLSSWPFQFTLGEGGGVYLYNAIVKAEELIAAHSMTHIISSYPPMTDHHIAHRLKQRHSDIYWIADFRDLPVDNVKKNIFAPAWHKKKYKKLFQDADECWAVSKGQSQLLGKLLNREVKIIRNGLPRQYSINTTAYQTRPFRITYTGSLYPHYPYAVFIKALQKFQEKEDIDVSNIEFHYAGKDGSLMHSCLKEANWHGKWIDHGNISLKESWELQKKAYINLLFSWSNKESKGILTGKLYEYLGARRPILAIVEGSKDEELNDLIQQYHGNESKVCTTVDCATELLIEYAQSYQQDQQLELLGEEERMKELYFDVNL